MKQTIDMLIETYHFYIFLFSHLFLLFIDHRAFVQLLYEYTETPARDYAEVIRLLEQLDQVEEQTEE